MPDVLSYSRYSAVSRLDSQQQMTGYIVANFPHFLFCSSYVVPGTSFELL